MAISPHRPIFQCSKVVIQSLTATVLTFIQWKLTRLTFAPLMKNYIDQTLGFTFLLLLMLVALSLVPEGTALGDFSLRRMDIFADVRRDITVPPDPLPPTIDTFQVTPEDTAALATIDSLQQDSVVIGPFPAKDSIFFGSTVEDYSFDQKGLGSFFAAVDAIKKGQTARIAWYGDSFVEGDILIGDLRDTLQTLWGGSGVGFVPITSEVAQFKRTLKHQFSHWNTFSIVKKSDLRPALGLNGYAYQPGAGASLTYEGASYFRNTRSWTDFRLFYTTSSPCDFEWKLQDKVARQDQLRAQNNRLGSWKWEGNYPGSNYINLQFPAQEGLVLYGAALESGPGIYIDNFSIRGNSGGPLKLLQPDFIKQFEALRHYDLVVLQVGLNAVTNSLNNIRWYQAELERTFNHLRACFPDKPILIVSVGDRGGKIGTELATMRSVPAIVAMQRDLARRHGFLFYDLFRGMGGAGTMIRMAMHRPRLANTDYTHLTHEGGRVVGLMFAKHLIAAQAQWRQQENLQ